MTDDLSMWAGGDTPETYGFTPDRSDPEMLELPATIIDRIERQHERIIELGIEYMPPGASSWRTASGKLMVDETNRPSVTGMGSQLMRLAERHAKTQENPEDCRYRTRIAYLDAQGDRKWISREFKVAVSGGKVVFDDNPEPDQRSNDIRLFRYIAETQMQERDRLMGFLMDREKAFAANVNTLSANVSKLTENFASVAQAISDVAKASATTLHEASELYRASEEKSVAQRKLELEAELARVDAAEKAKRWDIVEQTIPMAIPLILSKTMGIPPESAVMISQAVLGAQQGGPQGMMNMLGSGSPSPQMVPASSPPASLRAGHAPQQPQQPQQADPGLTDDIPSGADWTPPEKAPLMFSGTDEEGEGMPEGFDEHLNLWFHVLTDVQEQQTRAIVGGEIYDTLRDAAGKDHVTAGKALRQLKAKIDALDMTTRMKLARQLMVVLKDKAATLWNLLSVAAVDPSIPDG
jgi:hypothetical protein